MVEPSQLKISKFLQSDRVTFKGLEKENLRTDKEGKISNKNFPDAFGVHNYNRYITLDYSEPHLEIVTPPFEDNLALFGFSNDLHAYVENNLDGDLLWNYSMPPKFKSKYIKLPPHGETNKTKLAHLYRLGLRNRYGDKMQSTAGIHFNFSFFCKIWKMINFILNFLKLTLINIPPNRCLHPLNLFDNSNSEFPISNINYLSAQKAFFIWKNPIKPILMNIYFSPHFFTHYCNICL